LDSICVIRITVLLYRFSQFEFYKAEAGAEEAGGEGVEIPGRRGQGPRRPKIPSILAATTFFLIVVAPNYFNFLPMYECFVCMSRRMIVV
jgi:hypothetical protein